ncbi:hypothetical protein A2625_06430 [candidate division WOR-1 bacterium RIFCSPHIGHO2_01_FULL_53_15]|uniref:Uncharacterized protein n=1 Tax=candidate division WOR-1 bacterium RIFCSPHIGHO2_01_FULL_53_15 TaxID=1802564 RepID=A0A1F4Q1C3_UNCSA|nr:MAG: hypothetical protein A2625_06430 [candidate division WOR-1 bacterium RIFCSPHIGHO2_01_FULL_53_15]
MPAQPEMAEHGVHKTGGQEIMENNIPIKSQVERQKIINDRQRIKETDLKRRQERKAAKNIGVPERQVA